MNVSTLLNSDLSTLLQEARRGVDWWREELAGLVPAALRGGQRADRATLIFDGAGGFVDRQGRTPDAATRAAFGREGVVLVPGNTVLVRRIAAPPMTRADLTRMFALNAERHFPMPGGAVLLSSVAPGGGEGGTTAEIAALPEPFARSLAAAMQDCHLQPQSVRVAQVDGRPDARFDFLPAMRAAGLTETSPSPRRAWWSLVALLALLNLVAAIWVDAAAVDRLQALVDAQRPAVTVAQTMATRVRRNEAMAKAAVLRRRQIDALGTLAYVSAALPEGAWVQRYAWDGRALRLTGYRSRDADVAAALRRIPGFTRVKSGQTDAVAETATGQPFELAIEIGPGR